MCACVCVCEYIYVCVCVCERERERKIQEREKKERREGGREGWQCVFVIASTYNSSIARLLAHLLMRCVGTTSKRAA